MPCGPKAISTLSDLDGSRMAAQTAVMFRYATLFLILAAPAQAESLCGVSDAERLKEVLAGRWERSAAISLESETVSMLRRTPPEIAILTPEGGFATEFIDSVTGMALPLTPTSRQRYDVDAVDDMLDTTETEEFADILSDTPCGPEDLPQLRGYMPATEGMSASGTVTLIPYFDDRILEITELELKGEGALIFMTATALLTPRVD